MSDRTDAIERVFARIDRNETDAIARLTEFLRIPSVSTDPAFDAETRRCAEWAARELASLGFEAEAVATDGHPMVVATHPGAPGSEGRPRILYYGHYDVQPADPLELWSSPPFEPTIVPGHAFAGKPGKRIVARGAVDDKGQVMTFIEALRAWHEACGGPPCPVTVLLEGEEESGSRSLRPFLERHRARLAADVCVVSDTGMWDIETPAITTMLRGLVYVEVTLHGPGHDLHSGMYGGAVVNPINALASIVAELHDADRRVAIDGFYDAVRRPSERVLSRWAELDFDESAFLAEAGARAPFGEKGYSTLERTWSRPTCDCNGILGGYTGKGAKTVIPAFASVKLSCRLVADQDPQRIMESLRRFFESRCPRGCRLDFVSHGSSPAISVCDDSAYLRAASAGLREVFGREPVLIGTGGSIPAVGLFSEVLGLDSLLVGFGLDDDRVHSPDEKFELACFRNGIRSHAAILARLAETPLTRGGPASRAAAAPRA